MKVLNLTFTLLLFSFFSNAQMIVDDQGDIGIGPKYETTTSSPKVLDVDGSVHITPTTSNGSAEGMDVDYIAVWTGVYQTLLKFDTENYSGYIGTATDRLNKIYAGTMNANSYITNSDLSIKENVKPIVNATAKLMLVNPVTYDLRTSYFQNSADSMMDKLVNDAKSTSGVIAQELKEIYPELVVFDEDSELFGVNYQGLIPHLIKAIQEQQIIINELSAKVEKLEKGE